MRSTARAGIASAPQYAGLSLCSSMLMVAAVLQYVAALGVAGYAIYARANPAPTWMQEGSPSPFNPPPAALWGVFVGWLLVAFYIAVGGIVAHGLSTACVALRDMARNSWK
jgi:hypothetical protein